MRNRQVALGTLTLSVFSVVCLIGGSALAGGMILSDSNTGLAVNAYGGAKPGTTLKLVSNCTETNPDCT
jgi:hypothetical protein